MEILKLPVGIENFEDIRRSGFYYIDKTMFIEQFLNTWSEVTLFTRPRRFGFTDKDVQEILTYFNLSEHYADVKEWYDGYHFGNADVYCPWDVINYVDLLGLLGYKASWLIKSNTESGTGYSDILVELPNNRTGIVIELKYAENGDMDAACSEALKQIEEKSYVDKLKQDGMRNFIKYGIACFKKDCKVVVSE